MQSDKWDSRQRWLGDPKTIAREIRAQMARHDEHQPVIMNLIGVQRQALNRRMRGETKWQRWELMTLANHWDISTDTLLSENHTNGDDHPYPDDTLPGPKCSDCGAPGGEHYTHCVHWHG